MLTISSWTTQFTMRLRLVSIMWYLLSVRILRKSSKRSSVIALPLFALFMMLLWTMLSRISTIFRENFRQVVLNLGEPVRLCLQRKM